MALPCSTTSVPLPLPTDSPRSQTCADLCWLVVCVAMFVYLSTSFWGETYDDVFLAYQYAKNIEAGHGFVFNLGERFLGTPAPLFVIALVTFHSLLPQLTIPQIGTVLSCAGLTITAHVLYILSRSQGQRLRGAFMGLVAVFNPFSLLVLGGESPLYLSLIMGSFVAVSRRRLVLTGILLGLALMCRTEALIAIAVVVGALLFSKRKLPLALLAALVVTIAPWIGFAVWEFGSPLTNSFIAKVAQVQSGRKPFPFGFARWFQTIVFGQHPLLIASLLPAAVGAWIAATKSCSLRIVVLWGVAQTVAYCMMPIPFYHWYAAHVGVLAAILIGLGIFQGHTLVRESRGRAHKLLQACLFVCGITTLAACVTVVRSYDARWPHLPANELYVQTGQWLKENSPPDARIAYLEIGQIAFYADRYIIDTLGLVTPDVSQHVAKRDWLWPLKHYKPDYILYNPLFTTWPESDRIFNEPWFTEGFKEEVTLTTQSYPHPLRIFRRLPGASIPD
jgi:arabinofuranosyltransferase